jgi:hypothetical protein
MWFGGEKVGQGKRAKERGNGSNEGYQGNRQAPKYMECLDSLHVEVSSDPPPTRRTWINTTK